MRTEELLPELAGIIRRLEHRIQRDPKYASLLEVDTEDEAESFALDAIEDAIAGLIVLHIQLRRQGK